MTRSAPPRRTAGGYLIDAMVLLVIAGLVATVVLVRVRFVRPSPTVSGVTPSRVETGRAVHLTLRGTNLQPYFRVFITPAGRPQPMDADNPYKQEARVVAATSDSLEITLPELPPDAYDVSVSDEYRQLVSIPGGLQVAVPAYPRATVSATVRLFLWPAVIGRIHPGDADAVPASTPAALKTNPAIVTAVRVDPRITDEVTMRVAQLDPSDKFILYGTRTYRQTLDVTLRVPIVRNDSGHWTYKGQVLRAGEPFMVETPAIKWLGTVIAFEEPADRVDGRTP
jgi:hypothetical protein